MGRAANDLDRPQLLRQVVYEACARTSQRELRRPRAGLEAIDEYSAQPYHSIVNPTSAGPDSLHEILQKKLLTVSHSCANCGTPLRRATS